MQIKQQVPHSQLCNKRVLFETYLQCSYQLGGLSNTAFSLVSLCFLQYRLARIKLAKHAIYTQDYLSPGALPLTNVQAALA